jgi:ABC-type branched-subunit amino acid transport system substrate-binding protein
VFRAIRAARPDLVLLLLPPARQLDFYRAYDRSGLAFEVTGFPEPVTQTRAFFRALLQVAPRVARGAVRTVLWEPTYKAHGSLELSNRVLERWRHPMDGPVWASWFTVKSVWELVLRSGTSDPERLVDVLEKGAVAFDGHKGIALTFRPWDHQLRQPLAMSRLVGPSQDPMELAEAIGTFPNVLAPGRDPTQVLDQLGDRAQETRCRWR